MLPLRRGGDADDSASGPLTLTFIAIKDNAKLNTLEVKNAAGTVLVSMKAADLVDAGDAATIRAGGGRNRCSGMTRRRRWKRAKDLVRRMSLAEKVAQMRNHAPAIPRLGMPAYDYWNECLHGVARSGVATVFPASHRNGGHLGSAVAA